MTTVSTIQTSNSAIGALHTKARPASRKGLRQGGDVAKHSRGSSTGAAEADAGVGAWDEPYTPSAAQSNDAQPSAKSKYQKKKPGKAPRRDSRVEPNGTPETTSGIGKDEQQTPVKDAMPEVAGKFGPPQTEEKLRWSELAEEEFGDPSSARPASSLSRGSLTDAQINKKARQKAKLKEKKAARRAGLINSTEAPAASTAQPTDHHQVADHASSAHVDDENSATSRPTEVDAASSVSDETPFQLVASRRSAAPYRGRGRGGFEGSFAGSYAPAAAGRFSGRGGAFASRAFSREGRDHDQHSARSSSGGGWRSSLPRAGAAQPAAETAWPNGVSPPTMPRAQREALEREKNAAEATALASVATSSDIGQSAPSTAATTAASSPTPQSKALPDVETTQEDRPQDLQGQESDAYPPALCFGSIEATSVTQSDTTNTAPAALDRREDANAPAALAESSSDADAVRVRLPPSAIEEEGKGETQQPAATAAIDAAEGPQPQRLEAPVAIAIPIPNGLPKGFAIDADGQIWDIADAESKLVGLWSSDRVQDLLRVATHHAPAESQAPAQAPQHLPSASKSTLKSTTHIPKSAAKAAAFQPGPASTSTSVFSPSAYAPGALPPPHLHSEYPPNAYYPSHMGPFPSDFMNAPPYYSEGAEAGLHYYPSMDGPSMGGYPSPHDEREAQLYPGYPHGPGMLPPQHHFSQQQQQQPSSDQQQQHIENQQHHQQQHPGSVPPHMNPQHQHPAQHHHQQHPSQHLPAHAHAHGYPSPFFHPPGHGYPYPSGGSHATSGGMVYPGPAAVAHHDGHSATPDDYAAWGPSSDPAVLSVGA